MLVESRPVFSDCYQAHRTYQLVRDVMHCKHPLDLFELGIRILASRLRAILEKNETSL